MEPIKVKKLPVEYNYDKELLRLLAEANEKYGEYKLRKHSKMAKYIEDKIKIDKWASDVIVGYMKKIII